MHRRDMLLSASGATAAALMGASLRPREVVAQAGPDSDALAVMKADPRLRTWVTLVERSGLAANFQGSTPFTAFASTEAAFDRYPKVREQLLAKTTGAFPDISDVIVFIRSHIILGTHPIAELRAGKESLKSLVGTPVELKKTEPLTMSWVSPGGFTATATLNTAPLVARNAIIYPFDALILMNMDEEPR